MDRSWSARGTSRSQAQEGSEGPQLRRALRRRREWGAAGDMDDRHNSRLEEVDHHRSDAGHELCLPGSCFGTVGLYRLERFDQLHLRLVLSRGEVDVKAGSFRKPIPDDCGLVCTVVIHNEVNVEVGGHVRLDGIQEVRRSLRLRPSPQTCVDSPCSGRSVDWQRWHRRSAGRERAPQSNPEILPNRSGHHALVARNPERKGFAGMCIRFSDVLRNRVQLRLFARQAHTGLQLVNNDSSSWTFRCPLIPSRATFALKAAVYCFRCPMSSLYDSGFPP